MIQYNSVVMLFFCVKMSFVNVMCIILWFNFFSGLKIIEARLIKGWKNVFFTFSMFSTFSTCATCAHMTFCQCTVSNFVCTRFHYIQTYYNSRFHCAFGCRQLNQCMLIYCIPSMIIIFRVLHICILCGLLLFKWL